MVLKLGVKMRGFGLPARSVEAGFADGCRQFKIWSEYFTLSSSSSKFSKSTVYICIFNYLQFSETNYVHETSYATSFLSFQPRWSGSSADSEVYQPCLVCMSQVFFSHFCISPHEILNTVASAVSTQIVCAAYDLTRSAGFMLEKAISWSYYFNL